MSRSRWKMSLLVVCLAGIMLVGVPSVARADTGIPPTWVENLGGPGHANIYPSGLEIDPTDGSIVVADTGNHYVKKYSASGTLLWQSGGYGTGVGKFKDPRDAGVDSQGNIFVADTGNVRIAKLNPNGTWTTSWKGPVDDKIGSPMGVTVSGDKVYVADAMKKKVRVFDTNGNLLVSFGTQGTCVFSAIRDVDADSEGNVYVANYLQNNILKMTPSGQCISTWGSKGTGDGQFKNPYGVRLALDPIQGAQAVYVADSNNNRIQVFTRDGAFVAKMGTTGDYDELGTFSALRRVAVAADGDAWGADLWGWRLGRFDRAINGFTHAQTVEAVAPPLPPFVTSSVFNELREVAFDASGNLLIMDTVNQRVVFMDPTTGLPFQACGKRGWELGGFNWPRGVAVDQDTGEIWVADTKQSRLQIIRPDCAVVTDMGSVGTGLQNFNYPYSIRIRESDRIAWIADRKNNRILSYNVATRSPIASFGTKGSGLGQFNQPSGIGIDPASGHILIADTNNNRIVEVADSGGSNISVVRTLTSGFDKPEGVAVDSTGLIYVADTNDSEVVVLNPDGTQKATFSGHDTGFRFPQSITIDPDGRVLVSDTFHDRIQVFTYN